jgi:hypothetical protein
MRKLILLGFLFSAACGDDDAQAVPAMQSDAGLCTRCGGCEEVLPVESYNHVSGRIEYTEQPPASGNHNGRCWSDWGVLDTEVPPERWVHNLEHGGVVFLHRCEDGCDSDMQALRELATTNPRTLVTSYAQLPTRFGVVAWGVRLLSDCLDREAFQAFYDMHIAHGREDIDAPPPEVCARAEDPLAL